jgi:hypothetical protein
MQSGFGRQKTGTNTDNGDRRNQRKVVIRKPSVVGHQQESKFSAKRQNRIPGASAQVNRNPEAGNSLTRTKTLLLAALRVWELRNPVTENTESLTAKLTTRCVRSNR